jgi:hypothetical protein
LRKINEMRKRWQLRARRIEFASTRDGEQDSPGDAGAATPIASSREREDYEGGYTRRQGGPAGNGRQGIAGSRSSEDGAAGAR